MEIDNLELQICTDLRYHLTTLMREEVYFIDNLELLNYVQGCFVEIKVC